MLTNQEKVLINFRAFPGLVESFDNVCFLSGKTRTQVLTEMMKQRIATEGRKIVLKIEVSIGVQKGPPIGVQKGPPSSCSVTVMAGVPFALVAV